MSTPAGWYPQPDGRQRYWNGQRWTENFAPGAAPPVTTPVTTPATVGEPARRQFQNEDLNPMGGRPAPAPGPVQVHVQSTGSNGLAVAGFVLALLGALVSFIPILNIGGDFLAVLGLIFGVIGLVQSGKREAGKGLSIAAISLAVVAFVISFVVNTVTVATINNAIKNLPSVTATPFVPATTPATTAKVGETITLNGNAPGSKAAVTAVKVIDPTASTDGFSTPAAGSRYVAVQFQIQNTGTAAYDDSPSNGARVTDVSGQQFESSLVSSVSAGPVFPATVKLAPGEKALGYIVFEVPASSNVAAVQFAMDSGFADSGRWTVQ